MSPTEFAALMIFIPALVFFVWRAGVEWGASALLQGLHEDGYLTQEAQKELELPALDTNE